MVMKTVWLPPREGKPATIRVNIGGVKFDRPFTEVLSKCAARVLGNNARHYAVRLGGRWRIQHVNHPDALLFVPTLEAAEMWLMYKGEVF